MVRTKSVDLSLGGEVFLTVFLLLCSVFLLPVLQWMVGHLAK